MGASKCLAMPMHHHKVFSLRICQCFVHWKVRMNRSLRQMVIAARMYGNIIGLLGSSAMKRWITFNFIDLFDWDWRSISKFIGVFRNIKWRIGLFLFFDLLLCLLSFEYFLKLSYFLWIAALTQILKIRIFLHGIFCVCSWFRLFLFLVKLEIRII